MIRPLLAKWTKKTHVEKMGCLSKSVLANYLPPNPIVIEAGAHIGQDTVAMAKQWPKGEIYAFEPVPSLYRQLVQKTELFTNVHCYPYALSNISGEQKMYISDGASDGSSSLLKPKKHLDYHPEVFFETEIVVSSIRLDDWSRDKCENRIDFLWLDLQGYELSMLKAAPIVLGQVRVIYMEVSLVEVYEGCPLYPEVKNWLGKKGFKVVAELLPWKDMGNVLFVRR